MPRNHRKTRKPNARTIQRWEQRLAKEGLGVLGNATYWTFPGITAKGVGFTSLDAPAGAGDSFDATELFEADNVRDFGQLTGVQDTPRATYFQRLTRAAYALPANYKHRAFILAYVESGYLRATAERFKLDRRRGESILRAFFERSGLDYDSRPAIGRASDPLQCTDPDCNTLSAHSAHGTVKRLSRKEIARLDLTPPRSRDKAPT